MSAQTQVASSESDAVTHHTVTVRTDTCSRELEVEAGTMLRQALRDHGFSPHGAVSTVANCGGQGHCGACAVEVVEGAPAADQWFDQGLSAFSDRRLSCQVSVDGDMVVRL